MEFLYDGSLGAGALVTLIVALLFALGFEFVNGFHDTANAVATVIYTKSLSATQAVVWSGGWNFIGVMTSSGGVAFGIVALLPIELTLHVGSQTAFAMVFAVLTSAIIWNLGTWWLGLPASSSHTLIGSIVGVGLMSSHVINHNLGEGVNWGALGQTMTALLVSPVIGFLLAAALLLASRRLLRDPEFHRAPEGKAPSWRIRSVLVLTCTGVSFAHGSNDGQKGMGLIMLLLIGLAPATFALDLGTPKRTLDAALAASKAVVPILTATPAPGPLDEKTADRHLSQFIKNGVLDAWTLPSLALVNEHIMASIGKVKAVSELSTTDRSHMRRDIYLMDGAVTRLLKLAAVGDAEAAALDNLADEWEPLTNYVPAWVKVAVALTLSLGTMIGWKRIVVTVGEKIGKSHMTYAQGASAEIVTMATIGLADTMGVPVSTTHVLSSGIAGTMFANRSGLQRETV
ncbi:MAG: inorganic phosphate transporter, partial [Proteobacteria bacterium]|nr:inorganic phosphate transporter [Pseudomonadota bacterium]